MLRDRDQMMMQPVIMKNMEQVLATAAYDPFTDMPSPGMMATDYMKHMAVSMDAIKEVLTFMAAQDAMDIFGSNQHAANLYRRIIGAGLAAVFQNHTRGNYA